MQTSLAIVSYRRSYRASLGAASVPSVRCCFNPIFSLPIFSLPISSLPIFSLPRLFQDHSVGMPIWFLFALFEFLLLACCILSEVKKELFCTKFNLIDLFLFSSTRSDHGKCTQTRALNAVKSGSIMRWQFVSPERSGCIAVGRSPLFCLSQNRSIV